MPISVFVSSTQKDLVAHRKHLLSALQNSAAFPLAMEFFAAQSGDAEAVSLQTVEQCDLFVGIYAHRYGYRPHGTLSITEMEYEHARRLKKDCLVFVVHESYREGSLGTEAETDPTTQQQLASFIARLKTENVVAAPFTTPESLVISVLESVLRWVQRHVPAEQTNASIKPAVFIGGNVERGIIDSTFGDNTTIHFGDTR